MELPFIDVTIVELSLILHASRHSVQYVAVKSFFLYIFWPLL